MMKKPFPDATTNRSLAPFAFLDQAKTRLLFIASCLILLYGCVFFRLLDLSYLQSQAEKGWDSPKTLKSLMTSRSDIRDRNGIPIATNVITASLYADGRRIFDSEEAAMKIHRVLPHLNKDELRQKLSSKKPFLWLARHLTPEQKGKIINLGIPGVNFLREERRVYPQGNLFSHVVGFTDIDGNGLSGIEKSLDGSLRHAGRPIYLSLDVRFQNALFEALNYGMKHFHAEGANGIIVDQNGHVHAMVSLPDFDPNHYGQVKDEKRFFNHNTLGVYEMGSTMKIFNTALALESKKVNMKQKFETHKPMRIGRFQITDYHPAKYPMNVEEIFVKSSNIGSARMALEVGGEAQKAFFEKLGFFGETELEVPEKGKPIFPKKWRDITTITAAYGYGVAITPIHMVKAALGVLGTGKMRSLTLMKGRTQEGVRVSSQDTSDRLKDIMHRTVIEGTSRKVNLAGYEIGAKTGTSNAQKTNRRGYNKKDSHNSIVVKFGEYIIFVMLHKPKGLPETYGFNASGWNTTVVSRRVIQSLAQIEGIPPAAQNHDPIAGLIQNVKASH